MVHYDLYVVLDIFSCFVVAWTVAAREDAVIAKELLPRRLGCTASLEPIPADRGTSMTSKPVAQLLVDLGVGRSQSRPHVSDDNPYSEPRSRPEVRPVFPKNFESLADARAFGETFCGCYKHQHRHSEIDGTPPRRSTTA